MVLNEHLFEEVARLHVIDYVLRDLQLGVAGELLHGVRLVGEERLAREELKEDEPKRPHVQSTRGT
eukprot:CAMPEP_0174711644 /NCGR_PEP_ID=MMETSP1094-20130205/12899_1 /TAXON_ID=156173 /ORGANISM="Chrysochromulina brevifilum, Strain UTEX LB 985" /LENGTH=65 /DNA_ID=CAMNT_0015910609 /DNA_START=396 /DNA_END=593 /DNA_ORIENTATION=-